MATKMAATHKMATTPKTAVPQKIAATTKMAAKHPMVAWLKMTAIPQLAKLLHLATKSTQCVQNMVEERKGEPTQAKSPEKYQSETEKSATKCRPLKRKLVVVGGVQTAQIPLGPET